MKAPAAMKGMHLRIQVGVMDCLGCGNCVDVCMAKEKALKMVPFDGDPECAEAKNWNYCVKNVKSKQSLVDVKANPKNSQFATPLFEFSGACSGCGETPYVKLISQLFGDRQMVANATGCSSIYSGSIPSTPYTKDENGRGPAWANSLFEDFGEFGMGMVLANKKMKARIQRLLEEMIASDKTSEAYKEAAKEWIANQNDAEGSRAAADKLIPEIKKSAAAGCPVCKQLEELSHYLVKRSQWIIGGDGASYDIGYGGIDHVLASGEDVNVFVIDTEVYSNTGGQSSKATPIAAVAQFAAAGKRIKKKDLGLMQATYGYVYVAQIAMGADNAQCLKAIREAEAYPGPSLVIAYAPCINHGLKAKGAIGKSQAEEAKAVECGYWHLWRFDPRLAEQGKNPFQLDSKAPNWDKFQEFLDGEVRFLSLKKVLPAQADELYAATKRAAQERYATYVRLSRVDYSQEI
jgi:pyruvate-ferredoxin/flavodoxin oxidoreductase